MENVINHIFTVGFHHKRGCEIEFMYPPLDDESLKLKQHDIWKNLPSLALPDGAHKNNSDTINFIIPGIEDSNHKVLFGISCFKQISAESVKTKSDDITRNTVQKSVVVLARLPLYGAISSLLRGITENYFEIGNFEERDILIESFHQFNKHFQLILEDNLKKYSGITNVLYQELSITNLICQYEHDILSLIKMVLIHRKVLFFMEPMEKLTTTILSLISLFPGVMETKSFQNSLLLIEKSGPEHATKQMEPLSMATDIPIEATKEGLPPANINKSNSGDLKSTSGTSLFQNLKSSGGQTIKVIGSLATTGVGGTWWGGRPAAIPAPELEKNKQQLPDELPCPKPPFLGKEECGKDNEDTTLDNSKDNWGFPLDIFDENNVLLPYVNIGMLNILDNDEISSFIIGANNQLWKMKSSKYDLIINEDNKNGFAEFCQIQNQTKQDDFHTTKLLQLTVADRRFADYLLQIVKYHLKVNSSSAIVKSETLDSYSTLDLASEAGEEPLTSKTQETIHIHKFADSKELEEWLRQVLFDYIKAILLNAAALGSKSSFEDFGWDFILTVQQQTYFERWYYSIDRSTIVTEASESVRKLLVSESSQNVSTLAIGDNVESDNVWKPNSIKNFDHPGRLIQPKIGDNIPGYYQFREYADHSKALVNKSVSEIKRFGSERGGQLKSSVSAGLSKLTGMAKNRGIKLGSTWWPNDNKSDDKVIGETEKVDEQ